jgi:hypothetical protein
LVGWLPNFGTPNIWHTTVSSVHGSKAECTVWSYDSLLQQVGVKGLKQWSDLTDILAATMLNQFSKQPEQIERPAWIVGKQLVS